MPKEVKLQDFVGDLQKYFDSEAKRLRKDSDDVTPEVRAAFLAIPDSLEKCAFQIKQIEEAAAKEVEREVATVPQMKNLSKAEIAQIVESKKREKFEETGVLRTLFVISCASNKDMDDCLVFADQFGIKDLNSFDTKVCDIELSPLAAAMLRRKKSLAAMRQLELAGADIHMASIHGNNITHLASFFGANKEVIDHLIAQKVDFNRINKKGFTSLDIAARCRDLAFIVYLKENAQAKFHITSPAQQSEIEKEQERIAALMRSQAEDALVAGGAARRKIRGSDKNVTTVEKADPNATLSALQKYDVAQAVANKSDAGRSLATESKVVAPAVQNTNMQQDSQLKTSDAAAKEDEAQKLKEHEKKIHEQEHHDHKKNVIEEEKDVSAQSEESLLGMFLDDAVEDFEELADTVSDIVDVVTDENMMAAIAEELGLSGEEEEKTKGRAVSAAQEDVQVSPQAVADNVEKADATENKWQQHVKETTAKPSLDLNAIKENNPPKGDKKDDFVKDIISKGKSSGDESMVDKVTAPKISSPLVRSN